ncbi:MAG: glycosyltransferase [Ginsengibacter sp.]
MTRITFTVTNDLTYDQRMIRICNSLANAGYDVTLVGVNRKDSIPLVDKSFKQKRLSVLFQNGILFYVEFNFRLFLYLLFKKSNVFCCIDLDTMLPVYYTSVIRKKNRVYDAHEYFSQQKEIITRPRIYKIWHYIERKYVPRFRNGYTVAESIRDEFREKYNVDYEVIRNVSKLKPLEVPEKKLKSILYQGSINEARGFEFLIPAMKEVDAPLLIYGDGNFTEQAREIIRKNNLEEKVFLKGKVSPENLDEITKDSYIGINLVEPLGLNQYFSLANKFFDYMQHCIPQITMNFPEYKRVNDQFEIALLISELSVDSVSKAINRLLNDYELYQRLQYNCLLGRKIINWENEEIKLIQFYQNVT